MTKKALIIGHTGQDGFYLTQVLENRNYLVYGLSSSAVYTTNGNGIVLGSLMDLTYTESIIESVQPDELYYLAAVHQSSVEQSFDDLSFYKQTMDVNANAYLNVLNSLMKYAPSCKVFYASSSHIFGGTSSQSQNEETPVCPVSIYGVSKVLGMHFSDLYRQKGLDVSCGILYNHESPRRLSKFVSKKIVETAVSIYKKEATELVLGDLSACIDWGYAPDYMLAAHLMINSAKPGNYIVSSGHLYTVQDFVEEVFKQLGLEWREFVRENKGIILKRSVTILKGDSTKLRQTTGWNNSVDLKGMIAILLEAELNK
ncbi:MAG: GDP-mannose 4,6-dehydratase [Chitinophagaceae bacterium]